MTDEAEQSLEAFFSLAITDQIVLSTVISALVAQSPDPNGATESLRRTAFKTVSGILDDPRCPPRLKALIEKRVDQIFDGVQKF